MPDLAAAAARLVAVHALTFALIDRSTLNPGNGQPESDSDHTVMLGWLAPALAAVIAPELDAGLVAQFALVHDAVEVFAGDTCTIRASPGVLAGKKAREARAVTRWQQQLGAVLPWLPAMIARYEAQEEPEARFTRAADKLCPTLVHLAGNYDDLAAMGITAGELPAINDGERDAVAAYASDFPRLLALQRELHDLGTAMFREREAAEAGLPR